MLEYQRDDPRVQGLLDMVGVSFPSSLAHRIWECTKVLERLGQTNPNVVIWWCHNRLKRRHARILNHEGQIITETKDAIAEAPRHWKLFRRVPDLHLRLWYCTQRHPPHLSQMLKVISEAAAPWPSFEVIGALEDTVVRRWDYRWDPFVPLVRAVCRESERIGVDGDQRQLAHDYRGVYDWGLGEIARGGQINGRNWRNLKARADRWHETEVQLARDEERRQQIADQGGLSWNSLVQQQDIEGVRMVPLIDPLQLINEGTAMHTCVSAYARYCAQGRSRIFGVYREEQHVATCELRSAGDTWEVSQYTGPRNSMIDDPELKRVFEELARMYTQAWAETEPSERHLTYEFDGLEKLGHPE